MNSPHEAGYISPRDLAHLYRLTYGNVRLLAHRNHWRRYRDHHGRIHYNLDDVAATMNARSGSEPW